SLLQICEQLGVEISQVLDNVQKYEIYRRGSNPEHVDLGGGTRGIKLGNPFPEQKLDPFIFIVPPRYKSQARRGDGLGGEGFCYVQSGEVEIRYMERQFTLQQHDSMHYDLSKTLYLSNPPDAEARLLWVTSVVL